MENSLIELIYTDYCTLHEQSGMSGELILDQVLEKYKDLFEDTMNPINHYAWFSVALAQVKTKSVSYRVMRTVRTIIEEENKIDSMNTSRDRNTRQDQNSSAAFLKVLIEGYEESVKRALVGNT